MDQRLARWNDEMFAEHPTPYHKGIAGWIQRARVNTVRRLANIGPEDAVLELGCEAGGLLLDLPDCRRRVGADISRDALSEAQKRAERRGLKHVDFQQLDAQEPLPFEPGEFDVIISSEMLEHVHQPRKVLENVHVITDAHTRIVVTIPLEGPKILVKKILTKTGLMRLLFPGIEQGQSEWHLQHFSRRMLLEMVDDLFHVDTLKNVWGSHDAFLMRKRCGRAGQHTHHRCRCAEKHAA